MEYACTLKHQGLGEIIWILHTSIPIVLNSPNLHYFMNPVYTKTEAIHDWTNNSWTNNSWTATALYISLS